MGDGVADYFIGVCRSAVLPGALDVGFLRLGWSLVLHLGLYLGSGCAGLVRYLLVGLEVRPQCPLRCLCACWAQCWWCLGC